MPAQRSDLDMVVGLITSADGVAESVRTMLLDGLPWAVEENCKHAYQKEFVNLAGGVLQGSQRSAAEGLATVEAEVRAAEGALQELRATEEATTKVLEEAQAGAAAAEASAAAASKAVKEAEKQHKQAEAGTASFLKQRQADIQERDGVAAIVEGPLRLLVAGGWDDEEIKRPAVEAVEGLLVEVKADKVVAAAAAHALGQKPGSRGKFDGMVVDEVMKILPNHLSGLSSKLQESETEEVEKKAEILGLWAIADCARDASSVADEVLKGAREKQTAGEEGADGNRKRARAQEKEVATRANKVARAAKHLNEVVEAVAAVARLVAGAEKPVEQEA